VRACSPGASSRCSRRARADGAPRLLLDEPSLELAPTVIDELFASLTLRAERVTILLVDQMAGLALALAERLTSARGGTARTAARRTWRPTAHLKKPISARARIRRWISMKNT
jgi:ABC-type branched-subunit amino acid transport system ATPase component